MSPSRVPRPRTSAVRSPRATTFRCGEGQAARAASPSPANMLPLRDRCQLANKPTARANDQPGAPKLVDVLAQDLAGLLIPNVVVERPAVVGDLQPTVAPPARAEERPPDALAREQSSLREVDGPRFRTGAVTPAVPSPWVASEGRARPRPSKRIRPNRVLRTVRVADALVTLVARTPARASAGRLTMLAAATRASAPSMRL
jgi:hypothetical protein